MLRTWVTLINISRVLLNLTKRMIFPNVQRLLLSPNVYTVNSLFFSLAHQLRLPLALVFVLLPDLFG